VGTFM